MSAPISLDKINDMINECHRTLTLDNAIEWWDKMDDLRDEMNGIDDDGDEDLKLYKRSCIDLLLLSLSYLYDTIDKGTDNISPHARFMDTLYDQTWELTSKIDKLIRKQVFYNECRRSIKGKNELTNRSDAIQEKKKAAPQKTS